MNKSAWKLACEQADKTGSQPITVYPNNDLQAFNSPEQLAGMKEYYLLTKTEYIRLLANKEINDL